MDEEGDAVKHRHRDRRAWRLAVVITVQSVLVATCLAVTLKVYRDVATCCKQQVSNGKEDKNIFIQFQSIGGIEHNGTLTFSNYTNNKVDLENKSTIVFAHTGPYIFHMDVIFKSMNGELATGYLELQVRNPNAEGRDRSITVSKLEVESKTEIWKGFTSTVFINVPERASLYFYTSDCLKIEHAIIGFSYLLGTQENL